jgi:hypothetical protein
LRLPLDSANSESVRERHLIYADIMAVARERVDDAIFKSDPSRRAAEDAHLRLLPGLLRCDDERRHRFYLTTDRPRFARTCRNGSQRQFAALWDELAEHLPPCDETPAPPLAQYAGTIPLAYARANSSEA